MDEFGLLRSELSKIIGIALQAYANTPFENASATVRG